MALDLWEFDLGLPSEGAGMVTLMATMGDLGGEDDLEMGFATVAFHI